MNPFSHYSQLTPQECNRRETLGESRDNLAALLLNLKLADEYCRLEGLHLTGDLKEMQGIVALAIRQVEDQAIEEGI